MEGEAEVTALRAGDEAAFAALVEREHAVLRRLARSFVATDAVADEVVQETWLAVIEGIDRFEGRSSLRTWIHRILVNIARRHGVREHRSVPASSIGGGPAWPSSDFEADGEWAGHWVVGPAPWDGPAERAVAAETMAVVAATINDLPPVQRAVITLRDVEGWPPDEVCDVLDLTPGNQRVLLHRARGRVRAALAEVLS